MSTSRQVVLVRHGETEWTRSGQHTGRTDIPLTEEGRRQARLLRDALRGRSFALVLTSPLQRAAETARLAGLDATVREELREWDYGAYDGRTTPEIREARPGWNLWTDGVPDGETAQDVARRADRIVAVVLEADGDVIVFAHGHFLRVLAARWLGLPPRDGRLFALDPATISVLGFERERRVVRLWNAPPHAA